MKDAAPDAPLRLSPPPTGPRLRKPSPLPLPLPPPLPLPAPAPAPAPVPPPSPAMSTSASTSVSAGPSSCIATPCAVPLLVGAPRRRMRSLCLRRPRRGAPCAPDHLTGAAPAATDAPPTRLRAAGTCAREGREGGVRVAWCELTGGTVKQARGSAKIVGTVAPACLMTSAHRLVKNVCPTWYTTRRRHG